jgi:hypothetical protein
MNRSVLSTASIRLLVPPLPGIHFKQRSIHRRKPALKGVPLPYLESTRLNHAGTRYREISIDTSLSGKADRHPKDSAISSFQPIDIMAALPRRGGIR